MKKAAELYLKTLLLTILLFLCMAVANALINPVQASSSTGSAVPVLVYSFINALTLTLWIKNSGLHGIRLALVCFTVFWGVQYFMTQIETLFFDSAVKMPLPQIFRVVLSGALYTAVFSFLAAAVLGKFKKPEPPRAMPRQFRFHKPVFLRIFSLSVIYIAVYFIFGYFVAWQFPEIRIFYTGNPQMVSFIQQMLNQFRESPLIFPFQLFRGLLWSLLAAVIISSLKTDAVWKTCAITGLLFSVLITTPLLFPNAYMPAPVRFGHSFELSSSMLVFGILCGVLLKPAFPDSVPAVRQRAVQSDNGAAGQ